MSGKDEELKFEPLPMRKRMLATLDANQYCLWTKAGESREIKADTAYEAVKLSGLVDIIKVERLFSLGQNILDKSKFVAEAEMPDSGMQNPGQSVHDRIRTHKNPIISADEMDELMRSLRNEVQAPAEPLAMTETELAANLLEAAPVTQPESASYVPPPATMAAPETASSIGLDVHNDGFDEIIPAAQSPKGVPIKSPVPEAKPTLPQAPASVELPPERELSPDEVDKLLGGK